MYDDFMEVYDENAWIGIVYRVFGSSLILISPFIFQQPKLEVKGISYPIYSP